MSCRIAAGFNPSDCVLIAAGAYHDHLGIFNEADVASITYASDGIASAITLASGASGYLFVVEKGSLNWREEKGENMSSDQYTQELTFMIQDRDVAARNAIQDMIGANMIAVVHERSGKFYLLGDTDPLRLATDVNSSAEDELGDAVTLRATEAKGKAVQFFDTSEANTLTTLLGYLS